MICRIVALLIFKHEAQVVFCFFVHGVFIAQFFNKKLMNFSGKYLWEKCIAEDNCIHFNMVFAKFSSLWVFWWTIKHFLAILFQKGSKRGTDSEILHIHLVCIIFIFRPILMWLSSLNWLWRDFLVECRWVYILNISPNVFELKLTKRCQFPNFEGFYYFLLNCNSFFVVVKMFIFMRYLWVNTENKLFFFWKGG